MSSYGFMSRARQVVLDNLLNPQFGVSSLAQELGISRSELYRRIKEAEQKSASQFVREIRLERAKELLKTDQFSITEIAYQVGFNSPTYFSTCYKEYFGYSPSTIDENGNQPLAEVLSKTPRFRNWALPALIGALALFGVIWMLSGNKLERIEARKSLAVLKFDFIGADTTEYYRAHLLADGVINSLSNISGLKVIASSSSFQVDKSKACKQIGKELGAQYLVDGSLSNLDNGVKATVKLIDASTGHQIWARSFGSEQEGFTNLQEDISGKVAIELERIIPVNQKLLPFQRRTINMEALELYFDARKKGEVRYEDSIIQAIRWLEKAVELDPEFAEAYAELTFFYGRWHYYGSLNRTDRDRMMHNYLQKALELNPESPEVLFAKADYDYLNGDFLHDSTEIISGFRKALDINPNYHRSSYRLHQALRNIGKYHSAHGYLENALRLDPLNQLYNNVYARDLFWKWDEQEKAFEIIQEQASKDNPSRGAIFFKALMLADQPGGGDYLNAFKVISEALKKQPYTYGFMYWGRLLALDLDLVPLAKKYAHGNEIKFPDNPIYTYEPAYQICIAERRYQDALDLTRIWLEDKGLDEKVAYSKIARVYYLQGDIQKSQEILLAHFSDLYNDIEAGKLDIGSIQLPDVSLVTNYIEVLRSEGDNDKASLFADFLCSFYQAHDKRVMYGKKLFPLDCYYIQDDVDGFLDALEDTFFRTGRRMRIYGNLKISRYAAFEENPGYQKLLNRIEAETHRMRDEVVDYLKEEGDWDPSWDAALQ